MRVLPASTDRSATSVWGYNRAFAQTSEISAKEAFEAAKELGTVEAWEAFLKSFPTGFYADLARAYLKKLSDGGAAPPRATAQDAGAQARAGSRRPRRPRSDGPGQACGDARRPVHGLRRKVQPLLHRPDLEALEDRLCEPERQRRRREPRHTDVGARRRSRLRAPAPGSISSAASTRAASSSRRRPAAPTTTRSFFSPSAMRTSRSALR